MIVDDSPNTCFLGWMILDYGLLKDDSAAQSLKQKRTSLSVASTEASVKTHQLLPTRPVEHSQEVSASLLSSSTLVKDMSETSQAKTSQAN